MRFITIVMGMTAALLVGHGVAAAQSIGTFRWQQQPYCNVLQVSVVQQGSVYRIEGFDDLCSTTTRGVVTGLAIPNPDGTIGFGLTIVTAPSGGPVHLSARIAFPALSGLWASAGQTGSWTFVTGAGLGGTPRPPAPTGPPIGSFSIGGGIISDLGVPTAGGDATNKSYVDAQNLADRAYANTQNLADRVYTDAQALAVRTYADAQNLADRADTRAVASTPVPAAAYGALVVEGNATTSGCIAAQIGNGLTLYQPLAVPEGATLTGVRVTYRHGAVQGGILFTVRSTDFATGSAVNTTHATRATSVVSGTYLTETVPLTTPFVMGGVKKIFLIMETGVDDSSYCGATPVFTLP